MKVRVVGISEIVEYVKSLPRGVKIVAMRAIAEYIIGNDSHGLKHYPKRVQHGPGNPYKWQSEKQRKAYFASDGFGGGIPYKRTDALKNAWDYRETNSQWDRVNLVNTSGYGQYVQGDNLQRGHLADKWRHAIDVAQSNLRGAIQAAQRAVDKLIATKG